METMERSERFRQATFIIFALAIILAPFLAWLWDITFGLALMTLALTACGLLLRGAMVEAPQRTHRWLRVVIVTNFVLAVVCALALVRFLVR
jgi:hypothetical protein